MTHERARAELSARLDGEQSAELAKPLAEHLATCHPCQQWQRAADTLTAQVRRAPSQGGPDRTAEILAAVLADKPPRPSRTRRRFLFQVRAGLAAVTAAQFAVFILPALILGHAGDGAPVHASHELGAFELAMTVGFVAAAFRPSLARGILPLVGVAAGTLIILAVVDSALGYTTLSNEAPHLVTLAGALLVFLMARLSRGTEGPGQRGGQPRPGGNWPGGQIVSAAARAPRQGWRHVE
jgi:predicted anti-sigma-YlaC factor YlaD